MAASGNADLPGWFACHHVPYRLQQCEGVGGVQVTYSIHTVRVELYESSGDYVRLVLEILLTIWVCIHLFSELWAIIQARRRQVSSLHPVLTTQLVIHTADVETAWRPEN